MLYAFLKIMNLCLMDKDWTSETVTAVILFLVKYDTEQGV